MWAAFSGHEGMVRLLLDRGAAIDSADKVHALSVSIAWCR